MDVCELVQNAAISAAPEDIRQDFAKSQNLRNAIHIEEHNDLGNAISHFRDLCYNWAMRDFHVYAYVIRPAINYKLELKHFTI